MVFDVTKASDWEYKGVVNINSLEELLLFMEFNQNNVVIYRPVDNELHPNYEIKIYDGYLE